MSCYVNQQNKSMGAKNYKVPSLAISAKISRQQIQPEGLIASSEELQKPQELMHLQPAQMSALAS